MRKLLLLFFATILLFSLCACGGSQEQGTTPDSTETSPTTSSTAPTATEATVPTTTPTVPETLPATEPTEATHQHEYADGSCTTCGQKDPSTVQERMVWIPTKGGTKFHNSPTCSNMDEPRYVTYTEAKNAGFTTCMKCYK